MPGNQKKHYIFTADFLGNTNGYRYSIVNMAANLGLGAVESSTKNTLLFQSSTEKLTVAQHCNKQDFWLILREAGNNAFWVYLINQSGIQAPQKYSGGATIVKDTWNEVGYLEVSSNQKLLAHAVGPATVGGASKVEVFNFDNQNGSITGPFVTLPGYYFAYGVEFSPDGKLLYVSDINTPGAASVSQYNLTLGNDQAIINSKKTLITSTSYDYGAMQIAPNGKVYVAKEFGYDNGSQYLDIIHSPSTPGTGCNYQENGLQLLVGQSLIGLPNFPNYLFTAKPKIVAQKNCTTGAFDFLVENAEATSSVAWSFGDPSSGTANTSQSLQPSHTFSDTGFFEVKAIFLSPCGADTAVLTLQVKSNPLIADTWFCEGGQITLTGPTPNTLWNGIASGSTYFVDQSGAIQYQFIDFYGCLVTDFVQVSEVAPVVTTEQISICAGDTAWVFNQPVTVSSTFSKNHIADNGCDSTHIVTVSLQDFSSLSYSATICPGTSVTLYGTTYTQPGIYSDTLTAATGSGCDTLLTVTIVQNADTLFIPEKHSICSGDTLTVYGANLSRSGTYDFQEPSLAACVLIHRVEVELVALPVFVLGIGPSGCDGKPIGSIEVNGPQPGWQARLDGGDWTNTPIFEKLPPARYIVSVRNAQGCVSHDTVQVPETSPFLLKIRLDTAFAECGLLTATASHSSQLPVRYEWSPATGVSCPTCPMVELRPEQGQVYRLLAVDSAGCRAMAEVVARAEEIYHIYAPNVFSPNDDGHNDRFTLYGSRCARLIRRFGIYDRWGGLVFYRENLPLSEEAEGWDGYARNQITTPGVFTWWADVELHSGREVKLKGSVTVVR